MSIFLNKIVNNIGGSFSKFLAFISTLSVYLVLVFFTIDLTAISSGVNIANSDEDPNGDEIYTSSLSFIEDFQNNTACNLSLVSLSNVQCYGSNDGVITVEVDSGGGVYHYFLEMYNSSFPLNGGWQSVGQVPAPGQYTAVTIVPFTSLPADTFRVILEDTANQCYDTIGYPFISLVIEEPPQIINSEIIQSSTTPLISDGSINIFPSGGIMPYTFNWTGPNGYSSVSQNINNLFSGTYFLEITDSVGCIFYDTIIVNANQACGLGVFSSVSPICYGDANGQIVVNSVFGSAPFTYQLEVQDSITLSWNGVTSIIITDTFFTFSNLYGGVYRYTIIDDFGCSSSSPPINVQNPTPITTNNNIVFTTSSTSCNGQINSIINGGVAPINHFWTGPSGFVSNSPNLTNLCVGTYCDSIVDANGCNVVKCDVVDFEPPCSPEVEVTNIFCDDDSSGIAIVTKTNNAYPLFIWSNSNGDTLSSDTFALNLPEGVYTFNAFSLGVPNACPDTTISFSIVTPEINVFSLYGDTICEGYETAFSLETINTDTAFIYRAVIGTDIFYVGDTSISYPAGWYSYMIEVDTGNGFLTCVSNQYIQILENELSIDSIKIVDEICATSLGSIEVFASTNFLPLNYTLDSFSQMMNLFDELSEGSYNISVSDDLNCIVSLDSILVNLNTNIILDIDSSLETCRLDDGSITLFLQNGFGGYQYSIDSGATYSGTIYSDTLMIDSLSEGNYYLIVRDDSLCTYNYGNIYIGKTPNPKIDSVITKNESCCGFDGEISVFSTLSNSIGIYTIDTFNTDQISNIFDSLSRGTYLIYIEDTNACLDSIEIILEADSTPNINLTVGVTDVVCNGDSNGTFKVYYPDNCYTYKLHRYTFFTPQLVLDTGVYFNNLISGFYGVIATSNSGTCIDSSTVKFIDEPSPIFFDLPVINPVRCILDDSCNGSIYLPNTPSGGISPYYYYLKDLDENVPLGVLLSYDTLYSLCNSNYEIQIVDANACVVSDTIVIADSSLKIDSFNVQSISCFNGNDAVVEISGIGGVPGYSYLWSTFDTTKVIDSVSKGWYYVSITDSVNCFVSDSIFIDHPDTLQFDIISKKPETCMGVSYDGEIHLEIIGGTPPYNHLWDSYSGFSGNSGGGFGDTIFNLTYDTIFIDVTDANFCSASPVWVTQSVTIVDALNASNPLSFDTIVFSTDPLCFGSNNGFIDIDLNGGDLPVQFSIDSMNTWSLLDSFTNLNSGKYNIYVMDTYGCLDSSIININQYDEIIIHHDSIKNISCFEGSDGYLSISVMGGVSPYNYLWLPTLETTSSISNLYAIPHIVKVTDSAFCTQIDTIDLVELTDPIQTQSSIINIVSCYNGSDGVLTTTAIGGMPEYSYIWVDINLDTVSMSQNASGLSAGSYLVYVSDSFNCGPATDTIVMKQSPEITIDVINILDNICYGDRLGEFTFNVNGGYPSYTIYISDNQSSIYSSISNTISELPASDYAVWVVDANNCYSDTLSSVKLGEPGRIQIQKNISNLSCFKSGDGIMEINLLSGKPPYNYYVEHDGNLVQQGQVNQLDPFVVYDLDAEEYLVSVTDFNNCDVDSVLEILEPNQIIADFITVSDFGRETFVFQAENSSLGGHLYFWDFGNDSTRTLTFLQEVQMSYINQGEYEVMMVAHDSILGNLCNDTIVKVIDVEGYDLSNVFTPNNDGVNDLFHFNEWMLNGIYVEIFNRWGERIYHWDDINKAWDGRGYNGREAEEGVYFYRMTATGIDGSHFEENGSVTLIR
tara:strand:- start:1845 stop:7139 length:5295 start_codon:yes stop_codon:yes gene_type:complete